ncbi:hypothetical protein U9M48_041047 [Paspalum notatum var. saurae]|uniref:Uncharacterized protein n=1 Tax=Paspalum notatum var. saurae TaxID=547442 RepID=A0AAQ3XCY4_PASNO
MQRVADVPFEFAENPTWEVPEQAFAEEGNFANLGHNGNHDLWVKLYNLSRVFKTDISAVLTVKSGLDPHRLEFHVQSKWLMVIMAR